MTAIVYQLPDTTTDTATIDASSSDVGTPGIPPIFKRRPLPVGFGMTSLVCRVALLMVRLA